MSRRGRLGVATAAVSVLGCATALAGPAHPPTMPVSGATAHPVPVVVRVSAYPVYDRHGHRIGTARWRASTAGGNCCETYVSATPSGSLVESGGTYPWYTPDEGRHWFKVTFDLPDQNDNGYVLAGGEGATVVGPGGDVYGVTWDAYSGDHLQAYRYTAQTRTWQVSDIVVKSPAYDRPWLAYAQGPVTLDGAPTPHVLDVTGGEVTKDVDTLSPDGLDYSDPSYFYYDEKQTPAGRFRIPVVRNAAADWWQPHPGTHMLPLNAGGLLRFPGEKAAVTTGTACPAARLVAATATWQCVQLDARLAGVVRQDSRGYLTEVYPLPGNRALAFATSRDGGLRWRQTVLRSPVPAGSLEGDAGAELYDVVVNGHLGQAAVAARFDDAKGRGQDIVFRVDVSKPVPRLVRTYLVGKGDLNTANDAVTGLFADRFDYESVALLPDGHIAVSFDDSTCFQPVLRDPYRRSPEVAVLVD